MLLQVNYIEFNPRALGFLH